MIAILNFLSFLPQQIKSRGGYITNCASALPCVSHWSLTFYTDDIPKEKNGKRRKNKAKQMFSEKRKEQA